MQINKTEYQEVLATEVKVTQLKEADKARAKLILQTILKNLKDSDVAYVSITKNNYE